MVNRKILTRSGTRLEVPGSGRLDKKEVQYRVYTVTESTEQRYHET